MVRTAWKVWCAGIWPGIRAGRDDGEAMLIALLAILGVDLIVIVAVAAFVLGRRRWLKRQPGEFAGAIRVSGGDVDGLSPKWKRGSGRWVRDVLVWSKAPLMFRNELIPVDRLCGEQPANASGVKRLEDKPVIIELASGDARIEVATRAGHRDQVTAPLTIDVT
jgi:hypothetical protein